MVDILLFYYVMCNELVFSLVDFFFCCINYMFFMCDSLDSIVELVLDEMGWFYDWIEEEKVGYCVDVEAVFVNNDLVELKN